MLGGKYMGKYGKLLRFMVDTHDFEGSTFESIVRSHLKKKFHLLFYAEKEKLQEYDLELIKSAKRMEEHIGVINNSFIYKEIIESI
jgi:hypothetical protein